MGFSKSPGGRGRTVRWGEGFSLPPGESLSDVYFQLFSAGTCPQETVAIAEGKTFRCSFPDGS